MPVRRDGGDRRRRESAADELVNVGTRDAVDRFVRQVLQYEWSDYLDAYPPETGGRTWEWCDAGKPWGRLRPEDWRAACENGLDVHFEHHPTPERYASGELGFDLHVEDGVTGSADFSPGTPHRRFRDRFVERVERAKPSLSDGTEWTRFRVGGQDEHVLCRAEYRFTSFDERSYYETLRTAIADHGAVATLATETLSDVTTE